MAMRTIRLDEISLVGVDAEGRYAMAADADGELAGVSLAGEDEVVRDLSDIVVGCRVEVGTEECEVAPSAAQIGALRAEAGAAGDLEQVAICDRALAGDDVARTECARVIAAAQE
jgi:hypothetical protein